ncbi:MAG: Rcs stress response system protein RcsF [Reyranella sp.]
MKARTIGLLTMLAVAGCGPFIPVTKLDQVPSETMTAALNVRVIRIGTTQPNVSAYLGQVQGNSCKNMAFDPPPTTNDALLRMRVEAAQKGANTVMDVACNESGTDAWGTNCWASVSCKGVAVNATN